MVAGATSRYVAGRRQRMAGQIVKQIDHVAGDARIAGEQAEIGVEPGGADVVVAGADVDVAAQAGRFLANHQGELGVGLQAVHAEGDVSAGAFQFRGPVQIPLLVEAGLDLDDAGHLLAGLGGAGPAI